jgi:Fe-S cluster assembly iron-binding protein IscA
VSGLALAARGGPTSPTEEHILEDKMITLTASATKAIRTITEQPEVPVGSGLRIDTGTQPGSLSVAVTPGPIEGDTVLDESGARLFLGSAAVPFLEDKALDATVDAKGGVQFTVGEQPR